MEKKHYFFQQQQKNLFSDQNWLHFRLKQAQKNQNIPLVIVRTGTINARMR